MKSNAYDIDLESQTARLSAHVTLPPRVAQSPTSFDRHSDDSSLYSERYGSEKQPHGQTRPISAGSLPPYAPNTDPLDDGDEQTVSELAFKYGFVFPFLWIYGAYILISPLNAPPANSPLAWLPDKTEAEKQVYLLRQREEELVWARRSLIALISLVTTILVVVIVVLAVLRTRS
jgi:hypothetical protein